MLEQERVSSQLIASTWRQRRKDASTSMSIEINDSQKRSLNRPSWKVSLAISLLSLLAITSTLLVLVPPGKSARADTTSFSFTYTGDYDQTAQTTANLNYIANASGASFNLGLGDLSYASTLTKAEADAWSTYAKGKLPPNFPFEIVDGRHDSSQISTYETDLPNQIGNLSATCATQIPCTYGEQYYFDFPQNAPPLARFIMISPNQTIPGHTYNYNQGGADYNWVSNVIDAARAANIPWVIVGMHEFCFVIGTASCTNQQLLDLLLNKHVDVILQAQKHNYQRSKQLALNPTTCPTLSATSYNSACVANTTNNLTQGAGSVIMVTGTGGASQLAINASDPKYGYFQSSMPTNNVTWGVSQFTISATQLTEQFHGTSGGNFTDSFTITPGGAAPSPTATASGGTTIGQDSFQRPNQQFWGTASGGQTWAGSANSNKVFSISSNTGLVTGTTTNNYFAILGSGATDATTEFSGSISTLSNGAHIGAVLRWVDSQNWYEAYIDGTNLVLQKKVGGTTTRLGTTPFAATAATSYTLLFNISGSTLNASVWPTNGGSQPGNWMLTLTDTSLTTGNCGLHVSVQSGVTAQFTSFQATAP
jgi:hypothetical protein